MVRRRAVGATMVAAVVFAALLVCDLAVYVAAQDRAVLYSEADASDAMHQRFLVLEAVEGADVLYGAGALLASSAFQCPSAASAIALDIGGLSGSQAAGGLGVSVRAGLGGAGYEVDNLTALAPFEGSVPGELDIVLHYAASGTDGPGIDFTKSEVHYVHLGLRLQDAVSSCEAAAAAVAQALSRPAGNCSSASLGAEVVGAIRSQARLASEEGFALSASYSVAAASACSVSYDLQLVQNDVRGISSTFAVRFYEQGVVTVSSPAPRAQG
ncbi:MAG: hypothetical protein JRN56_03215 [Nitrososphaerota archaeon]|nr:hypothetical protein [Nitrososphaerota archaeon]MDG6961153.1 hypothetical protein [Nitrososphaerota archaeon]MDG6970536.1 hypothetical protein [Nitrososphaerota archaeon]MDG6980583.1 hypothetical protein [Nitrososphaerota archaeon]MDG6986638.1 hypothetical protein [Nitrososphaerota archaeon]